MFWWCNDVSVEWFSRKPDWNSHILYLMLLEIVHQLLMHDSPPNSLLGQQKWQRLVYNSCIDFFNLNFFWFIDRYYFGGFSVVTRTLIGGGVTSIATNLGYQLKQNGCEMTGFHLSGCWDLVKIGLGSWNRTLSFYDPLLHLRMLYKCKKCVIGKLAEHY